MDESANNPAGRLYDLLQKMKTVPDGPIEDAWRQVLQSGDSASVLLTRLGEVYALPDQIRREVATYPDDENQELLLRPLPTIEDALRRPLVQHVSEFSGHVDAATMTGLEWCAERMRRRSREGRLTSDQWATLESAILDLYGEIEKELSPEDELRRFLVDHVEDMLAAIQERAIRGTKAIQDAAERTIGSVIVYEKRDRRAERTRPWTEKLMAISAGALLFLSIGNQSLELAGRVYEPLAIESGSAHHAHHAHAVPEEEEEHERGGQ
jgi:hypothetical protein